MNRTNKSHQYGFTLIELLLAMAFFSSVLLVATLLLTQTLNIYNRGMTTKQMNQVGRTLIEDMIRATNSGKNIDTDTKDVGGKVVAGCLKIDKTVYLWNIANGVDGQYFSNGYYKYFEGSGNDPINFVKLTALDSTRCSLFGNGSDEGKVRRDQASPVVGDSVRVYETVLQHIASTDLVRVRMTLGTFYSIGSDYNPYYNGTNLECRAGGAGMFCAKANFETVLYVPNGGI